MDAARTDRSHLRVDPADLPWHSSDGAGAERKVLARDVLGDLEIAIVRLAPGGQLDADPDRAHEIVVMEGRWRLPEGELGPGGYTRRVAGALIGDSTEDGCTLFVRSGALDRGDSEITHAPLAPEDWVPGHGGLRVRPLHTVGAESTALVHWPAGERFVPHRHFGGEEIFVLSGVFEDEHGRYPAGTWLLSPHLSEHHPFVNEETLIFVKTGHAPPEPRG